MSEQFTKEITLHKVEKVTLACALCLMKDAIEKADIPSDVKIAPLAGIIAIMRIVDELELYEEMNMFLEE